MNTSTDKRSANFDLASLDLLEMEDSFYSDKRSFQPKGNKYIVFFLNDKIYGILSNQVAEIFQPLSITTLFNVPVWLLGIAGFRNEVISVIDLKKLWNKESSASSLKSKLIVLRSEESDSPVAFAVDKLSKIITLPDTNIKPFKEVGASHICGIASYESKTLHLLDAKKILSSLAI